MKLSVVVVSGLFALALSAASIRADDKIGIVLMHGKQGSPLGVAVVGSNRPPAGELLIAALKDAGYLVTTPEMCWSGRRALDKVFADCMKEIDDAIDDLKTHGATGIVVGGLSQGGLAAIAYGATHSDILGVVAYGPADDPANKARSPAVAAAIAKAQSMAADGKGGERSTFDDVNTGPQGSFTMTLTPPPISTSASMAQTLRPAFPATRRNSGCQSYGFPAMTTHRSAARHRHSTRRRPTRLTAMLRLPPTTSPPSMSAETRLWPGSRT